MKRSTAIKRLGDVAEGLDKSTGWPGMSITAAHVHGALLDGATEFDWLELAFVVDEPAESVPWMSRPAHLEGLASLLRFDKLPLAWRWRPASWPVWNHEIRRTACFWTASGSLDQAVLDGLASGRVDGLRLHRPENAEDLRQQLALERDVSRAHLAAMLDSFYDRDWRREHTGNDVDPEDHLWWATYALLSIDDVLMGEAPRA